MTIQVIGAGLGRTGTHSLALALEILGFGPCYTIHDVKKHPAHVDVWNDAIDGKEIDWSQLFQSYQSVVEWPAVSFLRELLSNYPQAKIILTLRDPNDWYESANSTIFDALELFIYNPNPPGKNRPTLELTRRLVLDKTFSGQYRDKGFTIQIYQQHIQNVIELVPASRLLQYRIAEGWEPLCQFLGVAVPKNPFPQVNERAGFLASAPAWFKKLTGHLKED
ncbi:MAG: sulfotransferase [Caldilineaceae bacterium]